MLYKQGETLAPGQPIEICLRLKTETQRVDLEAFSFLFCFPTPRNDWIPIWQWQSPQPAITNAKCHKQL